MVSKAAKRSEFDVNLQMQSIYLFVKFVTYLAMGLL